MLAGGIVDENAPLNICKKEFRDKWLDSLVCYINFSKILNKLM